MLKRPQPQFQVRAFGGIKIDAIRQQYQPQHLASYLVERQIKTMINRPKMVVVV